MTTMQALIEMSRRMADQMDRIKVDQDTLIVRLSAAAGPAKEREPA